MKFRNTTQKIEEGEEQSLADALRRISGSDPSGPPPPEAYWANLIVRTNDRIDAATSPKALTISWALRVALPGVLAIISFMVGLRYFVPPEHGGNLPLQAVFLSMPDRAVDSLLSDPSRLDAGLSVEDLGVDPFQMPNEDLADYLIASGTVSTVTETLSDDQVTDVLTLLGTYRADRLP